MFATSVAMHFPQAPNFGGITGSIQGKNHFHVTFAGEDLLKKDL